MCAFTPTPTCSPAFPGAGQNPRCSPSLPAPPQRPFSQIHSLLLQGETSLCSSWAFHPCHCFSFRLCPDTCPETPGCREKQVGHLQWKMNMQCLLHRSAHPAAFLSPRRLCRALHVRTIPSLGLSPQQLLKGLFNSELCKDSKEVRMTGATDMKGGLYPQKPQRQEPRQASTPEQRDLATTFLVLPSREGAPV